MENLLKVTFSVQGWTSQSIKLNEQHKNLTPEQLQEGLRSGKFCTSIIEDAKLIVTATGEEIGTVEDVDPDGLEYSDYEVEED